MSELLEISTTVEGIVQVCIYTTTENYQTCHRYNVLPGQDCSTMPVAVQEACAIAHTPAVIAAYLEVVPPAIVEKTYVQCACTKYFEDKLVAGFNYGGVTFQACKESQRLISARATYALANKIDAVAFPWVAPCNEGWWDINNNPLASTTTVDGFLAFAKAFFDYCSACSKCCRNHKNAITSENFATYDYTTGWPVNP